MTGESTSIIKNPSDAIHQNHYPSLNGLRGLSIIMVVFSHLHIFPGRIFNGALGVNIFFVLSGFLITTLCIKEINSTENLSLKKFYIRRILRIFPVAYLYLVVLLILNFLLNVAIPWFQFAGASFYVMNFSYFRADNFTWEVSHYWSLSVEEQFYLIFPFILKKNRRLFVFSVCFIVFVLPLLCSLQEIYPFLKQNVFYFFTHYFIKFQAISVGCLFSILTFHKTFDNKYLTNTKFVGNAIALFLIFYIPYEDFIQ